MKSVSSVEPVTSRKTLAQVVLCLGCCCGRTDKGHPPVPVDWMKQEWRARTLPKKVHLTISGCLGPCDVTNVVLVMMGDRQVWLGNLSTQDHYLLLADWASACAAADAVLPLPHALEPFHLDRFHAGPGTSRIFDSNQFDTQAQVA
jgi:cobaltochelatase CobN